MENFTYTIALISEKIQELSESINELKQILPHYKNNSVDVEDEEDGSNLQAESIQKTIDDQTAQMEALESNLNYILYI